MDVLVDSSAAFDQDLIESCAGRQAIGGLPEAADEAMTGPFGRTVAK